jgi:hypothetical protein
MIHTQPPSPERVLLLALFQNQLMCLQDLQAHLLTQMGTETVPLELGGLLEDIANRYLDISDLINERHFQARQEVHALSEGMLSEHPGAN